MHTVTAINIMGHQLIQYLAFVSYGFRLRRMKEIFDLVSKQPQ